MPSDTKYEYEVLSVLVPDLRRFLINKGAEGWRVVQLLPDLGGYLGKDVLVIFEKVAGRV